MSLEAMLSGWCDTDDQQYSKMTNEEVIQQFGYNKSYVSKIRNRVRDKELNRKAKELAKKYEEGQQWLDRTVVMIEMLKAIDQGLDDWKRQQK